MASRRAELIASGPSIADGEMLHPGAGLGGAGCFADISVAQPSGSARQYLKRPPLARTTDATALYAALDASYADREGLWHAMLAGHLFDDASGVCRICQIWHGWHKDQSGNCGSHDKFYHGNITPIRKPSPIIMGPMINHSASENRGGATSLAWVDLAYRWSAAATEPDSTPGSP